MDIKEFAYTKALRDAQARSEVPEGYMVGSHMRKYAKPDHPDYDWRSDGREIEDMDGS